MHKLFLFDPHINISYNTVTDILYADWTGNQTKESVIDGCEKILYYLQKEKCKKVLNDNTRVSSIWSDAAEWVAVDWFPRMHQAGCSFFAWVYSPNTYSRLSTDATLSFNIRDVMAITFDSFENAESWLKAV
ncbi:hypothetical protein HUW51_13775 [Adhaeribacter swui]|uniref:STAS/SEC14 domain-containing protein n=1 Tax=Adhaeribacter swui TaxID=2086471 RepID=A0A7G7G9A3_9BACT|nr:hypothetical protein [Adhaeribacter swui]QNF33737.1 hypothetical protein HUW51_13775 [Adhaeribacter swui]